MIDLLYIDDNAKHLKAFSEGLATEWNQHVGVTFPETVKITPTTDLLDSDLKEVAIYDGVILDIVWKKGREKIPYGVDLARRIRAQYPELPLVMLTEDARPETYGELLKIGVDAYLLKTSKPVNLCVQIWEGIARARKERRGHALYKLIRKCVKENSWQAEYVDAAASAAWRGERPRDRWNSFWTAMQQPLARFGLSTPFTHMREFFADTDLLLLGSVSHMRGHLEHVLSVYFTGYVISHSVPSFRSAAIQCARHLAFHEDRDGALSDEELWGYFQLAWLAAATLHDTAYAVELLPDIHSRCNAISDVFSKIVCKDKSIPAKWQVDQLDESCEALLQRIVGVLDHLYQHNPFTMRFMQENATFPKGEGRRVNHGVASGLLFLQKAEQPRTTKEKSPIQSVFLTWASAAMALHSLKVPGHKVGAIEMEKDPLSYLLMVCDEIQVWDRERPDANAYGSPFRISYLETFSISDNQVECTIEYVPYSDVKPTDNDYTEAIKELLLACDKDHVILSSYLRSKTLKNSILRKVNLADDKLFSDFSPVVF